MFKFYKEWKSKRDRIKYLNSLCVFERLTVSTPEELLEYISKEDLYEKHLFKYISSYFYSNDEYIVDSVMIFDKVLIVNAKEIDKHIVVEAFTTLKVMFKNECGIGNKELAIKIKEILTPYLN